jgi:Holliday junction resolvase RusA-like endonuclease
LITLLERRLRGEKVAIPLRAVKSQASRRYHRTVRSTAAIARAQNRAILPFKGPVVVSLDFYLQRPSRLTWKRKPMPATWAPVKPDIDNLQKAILDGMEDLIYANDSQVVAIQTRKQYAAGEGFGNPGPRVVVMVNELDGGEGHGMGAA